ncbi:MAG: hypothetical protein KJ063_08190 [Anaerolineae bacterium]|nr:hypothetical protein [Anaerolineae bacterium]
MSRGDGKKLQDQRVLVWLGLLWLGLAAAILISQLIRTPKIEFTWQTESEFQTAGYYVYRSDAPDGPYQRLNDTLIQTVSDAFTGGSYSYIDTDIEVNKIYYYRLEEVELSGVTTFYDAAPDEPISGSFRRLEWWAVVIIPLSSLVGVLLLNQSLRIKKEYEF